MRWWRRWLDVDRWFRPVSARPLAGLRIGLSLLLLFHLLWISGDALSLHGSRGIVPWELTELLRDPWVPGLPTLAKAFLPFGVGERDAITLVLSFYAGSLVSLALGFHARVSAVLAWGLHLSLVTSGSASYYGVDQLARTFLFYLVLFPSGRAWAISRRDSGLQSETIPVGCLRVMQAHLCVVYLAAGLDKAMGTQWWNGEAIWQTVSQPIFTTFELRWLAFRPWIPMLAGWGTLLVEIGYPFFVWPRRTRKVWCVATIGLHGSIALFMGLVFFSSIMILLTSCMFLIPERVPERAVVRARRPVLAALVALVFVPFFGRKAAAAKGPFDDLPPLVRRVMRRDRIPGVAVGIVENGRLVFARGFGFRSLDDRRPVTPDTLFSLGSCSKAFTATAIALLADERRLSLDTPVREVLSDFALRDPVASATLTIRDILTHQSGLPRHDLFWYGAQFAEGESARSSRDELYRRLRFLEPSSAPRAVWRYNSLMFVVAGRIVEHVSGQTWESFVQARILSPLEMGRTVLSTEAMRADANHATGYVLRDGVVREMPPPPGAGAIAPAGGVHASLTDLANWLTFHVARAPALLRLDAWRELHRPQVEMPPSDQPEVESRHYALGWIHESYRGHPLVVHNGAIDGFTVHLGFLPERGRGLVVLMNRDLASAALMAIAYSAYDRLLGLEPIEWTRRLKEEPTPLEDTTAAPIDFPIETLAGTYEHPAYGKLTVHARGDELAMEFRSFRLRLVYRGNRRFLSREPITDGAPQITVVFSEAKPGEPLELHVPLNFDEGDPMEIFTRVGP